MSRKRILIRLLLVIVAFAGVWLYQNRQPAVSPVPAPSHEPPVPSLQKPPAPSAAPVPSRIAMRPPKPEELAKIPPHPMAASIGSDKLVPEKEIALVLEFFQIYRREFGAFPAGETNAQFMNALRGTNPGKLPIFPLDHPRLDPKGNLLDPWQQPYIFHPVSRDRLEIRSAGPDKQIFTPDDLVTPR